MRAQFQGQRGCSRLIVSLTLVTPLLLTACGGGSDSASPHPPPPPPPPSMSITVVPSTATLREAASQSFSAMVTGSSNTAVTWSVMEGASGGAITTQGLYTAPQASGTYHVSATSQADTSKSATATVTVTTSAAAAVNFKPTGSMALARAGHTATLLLDGNVLVVGGCDQAGGDYCSPYASSELYDPAHGVFTATGSMGTGRESHTAVLLSDGRVLVAGGWNGALNPDSTAELYDPSTRSFSPTGSMGTARVWHVATLLPGGKVLITGGKATPDGTGLATAEVYDPATNSFSPTGNMATGRTNGTATRLQNGKVLIAGGWAGGSSPVALAELYDPGTGKFTPTGSMTVGRNGQTATLLTNGHVLVAGGYPNTGNANDTASAELYDPHSGSFSATGSMADKRNGHSATLLLDGRVLVAGGVHMPGGNTAELFDPASGTFSPAGTMTTRRVLQTATLLSDGRVLVAGGCIATGPDTCPSLATAELYQ